MSSRPRSGSSRTHHEKALDSDGDSTGMLSDDDGNFCCKEHLKLPYILILADLCNV